MSTSGDRSPIGDHARRRGVTLKTSNISLAGLARVVEGQATVDLLAGARYNSMGSGLEVTTGPYAGLKKSTTDNWLDGFAGVRLLVPLARAWTLVGYADVGTGGATLSWQAYAGLDIRFSRVFYGKLGYRYSYFRPRPGRWIHEAG